MKNRFTEEQIIGFLHKADARLPVSTLTKESRFKARTPSPPTCNAAKLRATVRNRCIAVLQDSPPKLPSCARTSNPPMTRPS